MRFFAKKWGCFLLFGLLVALAVVGPAASGHAGALSTPDTSSSATLPTETYSQATGPEATKAACQTPPNTAALNPAQHRLASAPADPMGVFGATLPRQGCLIGSYATAWGVNAGSMIGTDSVTAAYAVTHIYSTFTPAGIGVPHLVRNDPIDVKILAMGAGITYGLTDNLALTAAGTYFEKWQNVNVFKGMSGTTLEGVSNTSSDGVGDTFVAAVYHLFGDSMNSVNLNMGLSLPTGSTTVDSYTFNNSGVWSNKRAVYTLQLGTGTVDAMPGITYVGVLNQWTWGLSYRGRLPMDNNNQGYRYGYYNEFNGWAGYSWLKGLSTTLRLMGSLQGHISGYDPQIIGYGPCSNPLWFGSNHIDLLPGASISGRYFGMPRLTLVSELDLPLYQDVSGLHTGKDYSIAVGLKYKFN
jgi:hypothetical protein